MPRILTAFILLAIPAGVVSAQAQTVTTAYEDGDSFGYVIESAVSVGEGERLYTERAVSQHIVEAGEYVTSEFITFSEMRRAGADGVEVVLDAAATEVAPWQVSLEAMGGVPYPLEVPADMAAIMGDLQMFYRAAHPAFGAHRIETVYDQFSHGERHSREWASPDGPADPPDR